MTMIWVKEILMNALPDVCAVLVSCGANSTIRTIPDWSVAFIDDINDSYALNSVGSSS